MMVTFFQVEFLLNPSCRNPARAGLSCIALLLVIFAVGASPAQARLILFSTSGSAELAGLSFEDEDLVLFDPVRNAASLFFDGSLYKKDEDTNAVSVLPNGNLLLSTRTDAKLGGLSFEDGDIVEYDPLADSASLYFSEDQFRGNEEVSALTLLDNGNLVLSTRRSASLEGFAFEKSDLIEYDAATGHVSLFFDGGLFERNQNISAVHVLKNGNIALSTRKKATLGGVTFGDDSVVEYDPVTDSASVLFDGSALFSNRYEDIDALFIFEDIASYDRGLRQRLAFVSAPDTFALLAVSVLMLVLTREKKLLWL